MKQSHNSIFTLIIIPFWLSAQTQQTIQQIAGREIKSNVLKSKAFIYLFVQQTIILLTISNIKSKIIIILMIIYLFFMPVCIVTSHRRQCF